MQFALQALSLPRHAQNDQIFVHLPVDARKKILSPSSRSAVRILRDEGSHGRLLISGRMADVCAALNHLTVNEFACR